MEIESKTPDIRYLDDMRNVLCDKEWAETAKNAELYYMYRGIKKDGELRYDITVIPSKMLGQEFVKTKGHAHIGKYSELYMVLGGEAIYLMQKGEGKNIEDACAIKAKKGNVVIVPQGYAHITINPSNKDLKMANWVSEDCKSNYQMIEKMNGACYFYTKKGWLKNENYKKVPALRFIDPLKSKPENLNFLKTGRGGETGRHA